jgi:tRNA nucleotidyltransferase/poly(A) polymerase
MLSDEFQWSAMLDALADALAETGEEGWLVGGCMRDALLGKPVRDVDVTITGEPLAVAERMAQRAPLAVARLGHGTIRLSTRRLPDIHLDLTPLQGSDILSDLARRDFTVNAMALPLAARAHWLAILSGQSARLPDLIDPFHGHQHLLARRLVAVGPETFRDDPGRIVRAARLGARFGLRLDAETLRLAHEAVPLLSSLSADRLREEIALLLALPAATDGMESLNAMGALTTLFPGLRDDAVNHTFETLRQLDRLIGDSGTATTYPALGVWTANDTQRIALRRAMLAHAIDAHNGTPADSNGTLWQRALATLEIESAGERLHAARLLFLRAGKHEVAAVNALLVAVTCVFAGDDRPHRMALAARAEALIDAYLHDRQSLIPAPLLGGKDLMESLQLPAGPAIGWLLHAVRLAQLGGEITNHEEALAFARRLSLPGTNFTAPTSD